MAATWLANCGVGETTYRRLYGQDTGIIPIEGDILDRQSVDSAVRGCEAVFHVAAAYTFWSKDRTNVARTNIQGTINVLEAARRARVSRTVYTSTVGTIGLPKQGQGDENTPLNPETLHGHYKNSKHQAEQQALNITANDMPVIVVNPTLPVGPWDVKPTPTGKIILDFLRRKVPAYLKTGMNVVDVADVVDGHILAMEKGRPGERYILGNQNMSLKDLFDMISKLTGFSSHQASLLAGCCPRLCRPICRGDVARQGADNSIGRSSGIESPGLRKL